MSKVLFCVCLVAFLFNFVQSFVLNRNISPIFKLQRIFESNDENNDLQQTNTKDNQISSHKITKLMHKIEETEAEIASIKELTKTENEELMQLKAQYGSEIERVTKEFKRIKERSYEESRELSKKAKADAIKEILPISDNFLRAKQIFEPLETQNEKDIISSYEGIFTSLGGIIEEFGVKRVESLGKPFDFNMMEAIMIQPSTEYPKDIVMIEYQVGYRMDDKCVRPAMVVVSSGPGAQS